MELHLALHDSYVVTGPNYAVRIDPVLGIGVGAEHLVGRPRRGDDYRATIFSRVLPKQMALAAHLRRYLKDYGRLLPVCRRAVYLRALFSVSEQQVQCYASAEAGFSVLFPQLHVCRSVSSRAIFAYPTKKRSNDSLFLPGRKNERFARPFTLDMDKALSKKVNHMLGRVLVGPVFTVTIHCPQRIAALS